MKLQPQLAYPFSLFSSPHCSMLLRKCFLKILSATSEKCFNFCKKMFCVKIYEHEKMYKRSVEEIFKIFRRRNCLKELIDGEISNGGAIFYKITATSNFETNAISLSACFHCNATRQNNARHHGGRAKMRRDESSLTRNIGNGPKEKQFSNSIQYISKATQTAKAM